MASRLHEHKSIIFDTEQHIEGELCWCGPRYDKRYNLFLHPLKFESGKNVSTIDREYNA